MEQISNAAASALRDFVATTVTASVVENSIKVEILPRPHKPGNLPRGKMAVYSFFLNGMALKIGKTGPNSNARFRSQHYSRNSCRSNLANSIVTYPQKVGLRTPPTEVGLWIRKQTDRVNFIIPTELGKKFLSDLEEFLHRRWQPVFEGRVRS